MYTYCVCVVWHCNMYENNTSTIKVGHWVLAHDGDLSHYNIPSPIPMVRLWVFSKHT